MDKQELVAALQAGRNLVTVHGRIMLLTGVNDRPINCLDIRHPESGKRFIQSPGDIDAVIGSVDECQLPFSRIQSVPAQAGRAFVLPNGLSLKAGDRITLSRGEEAMFLAYNPRSPKYPIEVRMLTGTKAGRDMKYTLEAVKGKVEASVQVSA